jgi:hypothetical protein
VDEAIARSEADRLDRLQRSLLSAEAGGGPAGAAAGRGVRLRLARLALEETIRTDAAQGARRRREEFETALGAIVARVTQRPPAVLPPTPPPTRALPAAPVLPGRIPVPAPAAKFKPAAKPRRAPRPKPPPAPLPEFWTPGVVLGFRMWEVRGGLQGARKHWDRPEYEARCLSRRTGRDDGEVPHTDGRCGYPPCGLYCFKEPAQLVAAFGLPGGAAQWVLGLVSLSGKVVEHENGYRARNARVLAAAVAGRGLVIRIEGNARLQALFANPEATIAGLLSADPGVVEEVGNSVQMAEAVISYLSLARDFRE